ncbi:MAG: SusC/RagA family TonB-linked outer membrane protein, partial [Odoribacter sp.]|nr:SusC/RagA family TonB-linked outer membrane protein [Odoribacter sp.]
NRDGQLTKQWKAEDLVAAGVADSKYNGNFGLNGEYKGWGLSVVFTFLGGGDLYNQTLVDKVENANISYNVDKRVLLGRWKERGQQSQFRRIRNLTDDYIMGNMREPDNTRSTTRFVQKDNELNLSSLSVYYDFPRRWMRNIGFERIRLQANMNDVYKWSSIKIERGTSYPFARTLSLSLAATF